MKIFEPPSVQFGSLPSAAVFHWEGHHYIKLEQDSALSGPHALSLASAVLVPFGQETPVRSLPDAEMQPRCSPSEES